MAGAHGADVAPPLVFRRRKRLEDRSEAPYRARIAADHQAVAFGEAPYTAARAAVDEIDARSRERRSATYAVLVVGIPAIHDSVARLQQRRERRDVASVTSPQEPSAKAHVVREGATRSPSGGRPGADRSSARAIPPDVAADERWPPRTSRSVVGAHAPQADHPSSIVFFPPSSIRCRCIFCAPHGFAAPSSGTRTHRPLPAATRVRRQCRRRIAAPASGRDG